MVPSVSPGSPDRAPVGPGAAAESSAGQPASGAPAGADAVTRADAVAGAPAGDAAVAEALGGGEGEEPAKGAAGASGEGVAEAPAGGAADAEALAAAEGAVADTASVPSARIDAATPTRIDAATAGRARPQPPGLPRPGASSGAAPPEDPLAGHPDELRPLTDALIAAVLANRGYAFRTDSDGDLFGRWGDNVVYFFRLGTAGELLQVRTVAAPTFPIERVPALHAFCNGWNRDRLWPKAFVRVGDDGRARVCGEVVTDLERGVTAHQLDQLIERGISTGCQLALALTEAGLDGEGG